MKKFSIFFLLLVGLAYADCSGFSSSFSAGYDTYKGAIAAGVEETGLQNYVDHPEALLAAIISQESGWDARAVSQCGSAGIGQFIKTTARSYGLSVPEYEYAWCPSQETTTCRLVDSSGQLVKTKVSVCNRCTPESCDYVNDERFDTDAAIGAMARHLADLFARCGTMEAAVKAYNSGRCGVEADTGYFAKIEGYYNRWIACIGAPVSPTGNAGDGHAAETPYEHLAQTAAYKCEYPYDIYPCADVGACAAAGGVSYPRHCVGGNDYQCCVPADVMEELNHIRDGAGILTEETKNAVNGFLRDLEDKYKVAIFFDIENTVDNPAIKLDEIYRREELNDTTMRVLFLYDVSTKQTHKKGRCAYFTNLMYDIVLADKNKMLLDNDRYDEAFQGIAADIFNHINTDPKSVACSDVEMTEAARSFVVASMTGHDWLERLYSACNALPAMIETGARKTGVSISAESLSQEMCYGMLRTEIKNQLTGEIKKIDKAVADSYGATQYVARRPTCLQSQSQKYGCVAMPDGTFDLRECVYNNGVYSWEPDDGVADILGGAFGYRLNRAEKYPDYTGCRDVCFVYFQGDGLCTDQNANQLPVEYGTDNPLGALTGAVNRQDLQYDRDGVNAILQCYSRTNYRLADILQSAEYCPGMTIDVAGRVGQAFATDANVKVLKDVENVWGHGITDNLLCSLSWNAAQELDNPPVAVSTISTRDKINAYSLVLENCQGLGDEQYMVATALQKLRTLPESGFFTGVWNVVETFGEPTNLKIIAGTLVVTLAAPPMAVGIFGATPATAARVVGGVHAATSAYFAVPMAIGLPASMEACARAGIDSQRCGEAVTQAAMIYGLTKAAMKGAADVRVADVNLADVRVKVQERIAALEEQKTLMEERFRLQGCVVGCDFNMIKFLEKQLEELRKSDGLLAEDNAYIRTMLEFIGSNRELVETNKAVRVSLVEEMRNNLARSSDPNVAAFIRRMNSAMQAAEKDPLGDTITLDQTERGILDETRGVRVKPSTEPRPYRIEVPTDEALLSATPDMGNAIIYRTVLKDTFTDLTYRDAILDVLRKVDPEISLDSLTSNPLTLRSTFLGQGAFRITFLIEFEYAGKTNAFIAKVGETSLAEMESQRLLAGKGLMPELLSDRPIDSSIFVNKPTSVTFERAIAGTTVSSAAKKLTGDPVLLAELRDGMPDLEVFRGQPSDLYQLSGEQLGVLSSAVRSEMMQAVSGTVGKWWERMVTTENGVEVVPGISDGHMGNMMIFSENGRMKTIYVDPLHPLLPDINARTAVVNGYGYNVKIDFNNFVEQQMGYLEYSDRMPTILSSDAGFVGRTLGYRGNMHDFLDGMTRDNNLGGPAQTAAKIVGLREYMTERARSFESSGKSTMADTYNRYIGEINNFLRENYATLLEEAGIGVPLTV